MNTPQELIDAFQKDRWRTPDIYNKVLALREEKEEIYNFLELYLLTFEESATFFDALLAYLDEKKLSKLLELAFEKYSHKLDTAVMESIIDHISLISPVLLHPYLSTISKRESASYTAYFPWRDLEKDAIQLWKNKLQESKDTKEKAILIEMLLQTRDEDTIIYAYKCAKEYQVMSPESLLYYLEDVGYTIQNEQIVRYFSSHTFHMVFEPYYVKHSLHPTWNLEPHSISYKMGGEMYQSKQENPFCHMMTFDPVPEGIDIGLERVIFAMHIRELNEGYEPYYQHDKEGNPSKIITEDEIEIIYSQDTPLKQTKITLASTPKYWQRQDWAFSNSRENLFRVGGEPTWIQSAYVLSCPKCKEKMQYIMQFDSNLPDTSNGEVWFGSGGIAYVFWCDNCCVSGYSIQFT